MRQLSYMLVESNLCQRHQIWSTYFQGQNPLEKLTPRFPRGARSHQSIMFQHPKGIQHAPSSRGIWSAFTNAKNATLTGAEARIFQTTRCLRYGFSLSLRRATWLIRFFRQWETWFLCRGRLWFEYSFISLPVLYYEDERISGEF